MYSYLLIWAKFHWKIPLGKWFFKFGWNQNDRNENRLFGRDFETVQIFYIFFLKYGFD